MSGHDWQAEHGHEWQGVIGGPMWLEQEKA